MIEDHSYHPKRVLVVEGPAGAGKSTVCQQLADGYGIPTIKYPGVKDHLRAIPANKAPFVSESRDTQKALQAMWDPHCYCIIDRFMASQMVYQSLRDSQYHMSVLRDGEAPIWNWFQDLASNYFSEAAMHLQLRTGHLPTHLEADVRWVFLIPPDREIAARRRRTDRHYSYMIHKEAELYMLLAGYLKQIAMMRRKGSMNRIADPIYIVTKDLTEDISVEILNWLLHGE